MPANETLTQGAHRLYAARARERDAQEAAEDLEYAGSYMLVRPPYAQQRRPRRSPAGSGGRRSGSNDMQIFFWLGVLALLIYCGIAGNRQAPQPAYTEYQVVYVRQGIARAENAQGQAIQVQDNGQLHVGDIVRIK